MGELARKRLRGQARQNGLHIAIRCLFQRDVVSQCKCYLVSILALSVTYGDTSPKVRGLGREGQFIAPLKTPTCESRNIMVE